jgi:hypothetical protein
MATYPGLRHLAPLPQAFRVLGRIGLRDSGGSSSLEPGGNFICNKQVLP